MERMCLQRFGRCLSGNEILDTASDNLVVCGTGEFGQAAGGRDELSGYSRRTYGEFVPNGLFDKFVLTDVLPRRDFAQQLAQPLVSEPQWKDAPGFAHDRLSYSLA